MLMNIAGAQIPLPFTATGDDTVLVAGQPGKSIFVYECIGQNSLAGIVSLKSGAATILATQDLEANQGVTWSAIANLPGEPRFFTKPGEGLLMDVSAGTFTGDLLYAFRE